MVAGKCPKCDRVTDFAIKSCMYCGYEFDPMWSGVDLYMQWFKENTDIEPVEDDVNKVRVYFPYMIDPFTPFSLVVENEGTDAYLIHDEGQIISYLEVNGRNIEARSPTMKTIREICKQFGVTMSADIISVETAYNDFGASMHNMIRATMVIIYLVVSSKPR